MPSVSREAKSQRLPQLMHLKGHCCLNILIQVVHLLPYFDTSLHCFLILRGDNLLGMSQIKRGSLYSETALGDLKRRCFKMLMEGR